MIDIKEESKVSPYTWEGCVAKVADKIAFLGRDIEDAMILGFIKEEEVQELQHMIEKNLGIKIQKINNTNLIHEFISDLCRNSSHKYGIRFSDKYLEVMNKLHDFSRNRIYNHPRLNYFKEYAKLIIYSIFKALHQCYKPKDIISELNKYERVYPNLIHYFKEEWVLKYSGDGSAEQSKFGNKIVYKIKDEKDYCRSIIDFIAGMTDSFAIKMFEELTIF